MKAIFINCDLHKIYEVNYGQEDPNLKTLQEHIGGYIELAYMWESGDVLYVDEDGLRKNNDNWFLLSPRTDQPFSGHGIVVGPEKYNKEGKYLRTLPPTISIAELTPLITFLSFDEVRTWANLRHMR